MTRWWRKEDSRIEQGRGRTLPADAPVEFPRRWRQQESGTATERKTEKEDEKERKRGREGKKDIERHKHTRTHRYTHIHKEANKDRHKREGVW